MSQGRLYQSLPAVYRQRDADQGEPLRALLAVIEGELRLLEDDIGHLYDNWFIETCDEWMVHYIGDLLDIRGLLPVGNGALSQRALVANTLGYRRRKGTASMLEQLARDVTGWPAKAVEFFERLATTQHLNHLRPANLCTADLRDGDGLELIHGPFERAAHNADVRHIDDGRGRYNIPNVGLFLWRLQPYAVSRGTARPVAAAPDGRYTLSPLGTDAPLFNRPRVEREISHLADEENVPAPLRRRPLYEELESLRQDPSTPRRYFGGDPIFQVFIRGEEKPLPPEQLRVCHLGGWRRPPEPADPTERSQVVAMVDPVLGRISFAGNVAADPVEVSYAYGFSADVGGGPYDRQASVAQWLDPADRRELWQVGVTREAPAGDERLVGTLADAVRAWNDSVSGGEDRVGIIAVMDSRTYVEDLTGEKSLNVPAGSKLALVAANWPETPDPDLPGSKRRLAGDLSPDILRPHLRGDLSVRGGDATSTAVAGELVLDGLLVEGTLNVQAGNLGSLDLSNCTLVPGRSLTPSGEPREPDKPSVVVDSTNDRLRLRVSRSITGPLRLPSEMAGLEVRDSIVDSPLQSGRAWSSPALVSGGPPAVVTAESPAVQVTIGEEGPHRAVLPERPATLAQARDQLQFAIRAAHPGLAFSRARVVTPPGAERLIVLPGIPASVTIENADEDATASELKLDPARKIYALIGGSLAGFSGLSADSPSVSVTAGDEGPREAVFPELPATVVQARDQLQAAIRGVPGASQALADALVGDLGARLVVLAGTDQPSRISLGTTPEDSTTLAELALEIARPAIASGELGDLPGPPTTLERSTMLGAVYVEELLLASETLFTVPPLAERRQSGCVRFSYVPPGARTPQRYRCQPETEAAARVSETERRAGRELSAVEREFIRAAVEHSLVPAFTATRYGKSAYAQLAPECPLQILTGAEDEGEIGAFHHLQQAQRVENLRASLGEYLRFGLEAGMFLVN